MTRTALQSYRELQLETDRLTARLTARYRQHLNCGAGCSHCCQHHLSVFPIEAALMKTAIEQLPETTRRMIEQQSDEVQQRESEGKTVACPLLVEDRCAIYEARPLICRTQGLPLLYQADDGEMEVDFCPLNFSAKDATKDLEEENLVPLDSLNLELAALNLQHCQEQGIEPSNALKRISIAEISDASFQITVTGNSQSDTQPA